MGDSLGIELSILEGIDEKLLGRLHEAGIRTRDELGQRLATNASRRELADRLDVPVRRLEILHHLNFVLPEERADQFLNLQRGADHRFLELRHAIGAQGILAGVALLLALLGLVLLFVTRPPSPERRLADLETRVGQAESDLSVLRPLGAEAASEHLTRALSGLGPAPGWWGPLTWTAEDHRRLTAAFGETEESARARALSVALLRLAEIENAPLDSFTVSFRAREMARVLDSFPSPRRPAHPWDWAAVALRERFRTRSLGTARGEESDLQGLAAMPWSWTSPGFVGSEVIESRLESMPLEAARMGEWIEGVKLLAQAAAAGAQPFEGQPEALARDYWIRLGEARLGVAALLLGNVDLPSYSTLAPHRFLRHRGAALAQTLAAAPATARAPLSWLAVEFAEADLLAAWWEANPGRAAAVTGKPWAEALDVVEKERGREGLIASAELESALRQALQASGDSAAADTASGAVYAAARTRWEAGLRPLLMVTRARALKPRKR